MRCSLVLIGGLSIFLLISASCGGQSRNPDIKATEGVSCVWGDSLEIRGVRGIFVIYNAKEVAQKLNRMGERAWLVELSRREDVSAILDGVDDGEYPAHEHQILCCDVAYNVFASCHPKMQPLRYMDTRKARDKNINDLIDELSLSRK